MQNWSFKNQGLRFDIVFLDPPYAMKDVYRSVPERLVKDDLLSRSRHRRFGVRGRSRTSFLALSGG